MSRMKFVIGLTLFGYSVGVLFALAFLQSTGATLAFFSGITGWVAYALSFVDSTYEHDVQRRAYALGFTTDESVVLASSGWRECWRIDDEYRTWAGGQLTEMRERRVDAELAKLYKEF